MKTPTVALLHGFAGHAESWNAVRAAIHERHEHRVEAITLFGHDETKRPAHVIDFDEEVERLAGAIRALEPPVRLCGYSLGGRLALGILARSPELVSSAVLVGAHPGLKTDAERRERAAADAVWVQMLENEGIDAFAEKWQAQPLFATQARLPPERLAAQDAIRRRHDPHSLGLAMASLSLGRMPSYNELLRTLTIPIELVVGAEDEKFLALAGRMKGQLGRGRLLKIRGVGHNVMLERPDLLAQIIAGDEAGAQAPDIEVL